MLDGSIRSSAPLPVDRTNDEDEDGRRGRKANGTEYSKREDKGKCAPDPPSILGMRACARRSVVRLQPTRVHPASLAGE